MNQQSLQELIEDIYEAAFRADVITLDGLTKQLHTIGTDEAKGIALYAEASTARILGKKDRCIELFMESSVVLNGLNTGVRARALMNLGRLFADRGKHEQAEAYFDQARHEYSVLGDMVGIARVNANHATMLQSLNEHDRAYELLNAALKEFRAHDLPYDVAIALTNLAATLSLRGEVDEVFASLQEARSIYDARDDHHGATQILIRLTGLYQSLGESSVALRCADEAIARAQRISDPSLRAQAYGRAADVLWQMGDFARSIECYNREMAEHESIQNFNGMARVQLGLGTVYWNQGDISTALEYFHRTLAIEEPLSVRSNTAHALGNIGTVYISLGDPTRALPYQLESLELHERSGLLNDVADAHAIVASTYMELGDIESAMLHSTKAMELNIQLQRHGEEAFSVLSHSALLIQMGKIAEAREAMSVLERKNIQSPMYRSMFHANKGKLLAMEGDLDAAMEQYEIALEICTAHNYRVDLPEIHRELRELSLKKNDLAGYVKHNEAFQQTTEELRGTKRAHQIATLEAERRIASERAERERERTILYSTLPRHIADRVIRGEQVTDHIEEATVVFIDIVDFTSHTESMDPRDVIALLESVYKQFDQIMSTHGLLKIKTIGDSYMAVALDHNHAHSAVEASIAVLCLPLTWPDGEKLLLRIGIHDGPVVAGVIATERMQYDVWGDTVNVASRLESSGEPGRIHISQQLYDALIREGQENPWQITLRGETELKGKGKLTTYWIDR